MILRLFFTCLALGVALPAIGEGPGDPASADTIAPATEAANQPSQAQREQATAMYERRRAELEGKLRVEQVLLKGTGEKGVEIVVTYRIVDAEKYAAHPKTTFVADEASSKLVPLTKLSKLFDPLPAVEAEKMPPASLTLWDKDGVIKPGQPVTVVVAGYGQKHLLPVAGPDYDPQAVATVAASKRNLYAAPDAEITVHEVKVVAQGHMLNVRFSSKGIRRLDAARDQTYIENPETGDRHPVVQVPRIGTLAPKDLEGVSGSYMVIDNAGEQIKPGQHVNVVVSGVRAENIPVVREYQ